jgi:hypothetical protein
MHRSWYGFGGWLVWMLGATGPVDACAVCGFGQGDRTMVYFTAGWIMNAVPLALIGSVAWYLWRQACSPLPEHTAGQGTVPAAPDTAPTADPCVAMQVEHGR